MTTSSLTSPVTRETSAWVRDKGQRAVIATLQGGVLILRPKGLRNRETLDLATLYQLAVKQRVAETQTKKRAAHKAKRGRK